MSDLTAKKTIVVPEFEFKKDRFMYALTKRFFDLFASLLLIIILLVPMVIVFIIVKLDGGPAIFKQQRLGKNGKQFTILKFRTMVVHAEEDGFKWATPDDPRVTKFGRFLRKVQIDEWPQFFNILIGQMSFVGPRPEVKDLHDKFCQYVIGFERRLLVKPGLTGWAQVNGGATLLPEEKIMFDIEYIKRRSLAFDLKCLWKTIKVIFHPQGD